MGKFPIVNAREKTLECCFGHQVVQCVGNKFFNSFETTHDYCLYCNKTVDFSKPRWRCPTCFGNQNTGWNWCGPCID